MIKNLSIVILLAVCCIQAYTHYFRYIPLKNPNKEEVIRIYMVQNNYFENVKLKVGYVATNPNCKKTVFFSGAQIIRSESEQLGFVPNGNSSQASFYKDLYSPGYCAWALTSLSLVSELTPSRFISISGLLARSHYALPEASAPKFKSYTCNYTPSGLRCEGHVNIPSLDSADILIWRINK